MRTHVFIDTTNDRIHVSAVSKLLVVVPFRARHKQRTTYSNIIVMNSIGFYVIRLIHSLQRLILPLIFTSVSSITQASKVYLDFSRASVQFRYYLYNILKSYDNVNESISQYKLVHFHLCDVKENFKQRRISGWKHICQTTPTNLADTNIRQGPDPPACLCHFLFFPFFFGVV